MAAAFEIDQSSVVDNDKERQFEFTADIDGDERDFAVPYAVLTELSGDGPDGDALELFARSATKSQMSPSISLRANRPPAR